MTVPVPYAIIEKTSISLLGGTETSFMRLSFGAAFQQAGEHHTPLELLKICESIGFRCYDLGISVNMAGENRDAHAEHFKNLFLEDRKSVV